MYLMLGKLQKRPKDPQLASCTLAKKLNYTMYHCILLIVVPRACMYMHVYEKCDLALNLLCYLQKKKLITRKIFYVSLT